MRTFCLLSMVTVWLVACGGPTGAITGDPLVAASPPSGGSPDATTTSVVVEPFPDSDAATLLSPEARVSATFDELMKIRLACGRRPTRCDVDAVAVPGSAMHAELAETMDERARAGIVASSRGSLRYRIESVVIEDDVARVSTCSLDDIVLMMDGSVFDESRVSARSEWTMVSVDGEWKWSDARVVDSTTEEDLCGFAD
jgi:hypothetical protein